MAHPSTHLMVSGNKAAGANVKMSGAMCTPPLPPLHIFMVLCLIKNTNTFTFTF